MNGAWSTLGARFALAAAFVPGLASIPACAPGSPAPSESGAAAGSSAAEAAPAEASGIVSLIPSATELLAHVGLGDALIGRSVHCNFPESVLALPTVGDGMQPDLERIVALRPETVVVTEAQAGATWLPTLEGAGIDVVQLPDAALDDIPRAMRLLGTELGAPDAESAAVAFETQLAELRARQWPEPPLRMLVIVAHEPLYAAGPESRVDALIRFAGGTNALAAGDWVRLDEETLVVAQPDVIADATTTFDIAFWQARPMLPAVAAQRVCAIDPDVLSRPGPRILDTVDALERCAGRSLVPAAADDASVLRADEAAPGSGAGAGSGTAP